MTESDRFLTLIAQQERRVLELKEELSKAEGDLERLKKQWAVSEARKKRGELRGSKQLLPLSTVALPKETELGVGFGDGREGHGGGGGGGGGFREPGKRPYPSKRRESVKKQQQQQPQRRVFEGSRHTKALSLLSPKILSDQELQALRSTTHPSRFDPSETPFPRTDNNINNRLIRAETTPNPTTSSSSKTATYSNSTDVPLTTSPASPTRPKGDILNPAKQLVGDFREGLWTFFEDLRQATVGDDISALDSRHHAKRDSISASSIQQQRPTSPSKAQPLPKIAPQKSGSEEKLTTRARRTSSKNEGYAFRLEESLQEKTKEAKPEIPLDDHAKRKDHITLPRRNTTTSTPQRSKNNFEGSAITSEDPDGWDNWDSSPIAARTITTTSSSTPRAFSSSSSTYNTDPSSSLASPTTPKTDTSSSSSSVRTSLSLNSANNDATPRPLSKSSSAAATAASATADVVDGDPVASASSSSQIGHDTVQGEEEEKEEERQGEGQGGVGDTDTDNAIP